MDFLTAIFRKAFSLFMAFLAFLGFNMPGSKTDVEVDHKSDSTNYTYVFLHGFWGWGEYDEANATLPYWGFTTGDMIKTLNEKGYKTVAASVDPVGSAWDRACELYAQLTGTIVDYGKAHSEKYGHNRYGTDYTGKALIPSWNSTDKINIIAHSFGGPTSTLFASLMAYGDEEEINATTDGSLSDFFKGSKADWIYSITGLACTYKGTSFVVSNQAIGASGEALNIKISDYLPLANSSQLSLIGNFIDGIVTIGKFATSGEVADPDTALYDMHPDNAKVLDSTIKIVDGIYYFSVPHCCTKASSDGTYQEVDLSVADFGFAPIAQILGKTNDVTAGGIVLDSTWQENDGLVNTISEIAPYDVTVNLVSQNPSIELGTNGFSKGIFNVFPTRAGSHMSLMGNVTRPDSTAINYISDLMNMINAM